MTRGKQTELVVRTEELTRWSGARQLPDMFGYVDIWRRLLSWRQYRALSPCHLAWGEQRGEPYGQLMVPISIISKLADNAVMCRDAGQSFITIAIEDDLQNDFHLRCNDEIIYTSNFGMVGEGP